MDELKNATVTFKGIEDLATKVLVDTDAGKFSFFKLKIDETPTRAIETLKALDPKPGEIIEISYKETVSKSNGKTYRNAVAFYAPKEGTMPLPRPEAPEARNEVLMNLTENIHKLDDRLRILENRIALLELPEEKDKVSISDVPF